MTSATFTQALGSFEPNGGLRRTTDELPAMRPALPNQRTSSWKSVVWLAAMVVAVAAVAVFAQPWKVWHSPVAASQQHDKIAREVSVSRPTPAEDTQVLLPATIRPWQVTTLHARVSGYLKSWAADLGARVQAGDVLAEIETPELDQELIEGIAQAHEALAAVEQAKAERNEAEADLKSAEAEVARARAEASLARSQLARREKLVAPGVVTQEEYDTFQKQVETRSAEVTAAESELARRRANLVTRAAVIAAREATHKSRQANVDRLKELQGFQRIIAPIDGVITHREAEVGMLVTAGKEPLFTIEDMSRVRVQVNVPQAYAAQTRVGAKATVALPDAAMPPVAGTVTRVSDSVDASTRTMLAEIELENSKFQWQPGSYAQVGLVTSLSGTAWTIPTNTLQMRVEGPHVAVVDERNQVEVRAVKLGRDLGNRVVVSSGIDGHERLIINPTDGLVSGESVQVREAAETPKLAQR